MLRVEMKYDERQSPEAMIVTGQSGGYLLPYLLADRILSNLYCRVLVHVALGKRLSRIDMDTPRAALMGACMVLMQCFGAWHPSAGVKE
jgi:hypothetical protein